MHDATRGGRPRLCRRENARHARPGPRIRFRVCLREGRHNERPLSAAHDCQRCPGGAVAAGRDKVGRNKAIVPTFRLGPCDADHIRYGLIAWHPSWSSALRRHDYDLRSLGYPEHVNELRSLERE
jgi:hypothetical protein